MPKHVLLVEPNYYTQYPPIGLLKLSAYHKTLGDTTELVRGVTDKISKTPDSIYVTSLFTWSWKPVWEAVRYYSNFFPKSDLRLGGLYASLMSEHAALSGINPVHIHKGLFFEAENLLPDYDLVPKWNEEAKASIIFASRGCLRNCTFCAVPKVEGPLNSEKTSIKHLVWTGHKRIILFDNNFLASSNWESVIQEIEDLDLGVDFNQGLDARLINEKVAQRITRLKIDPFVRLSYDYKGMGKSVEKAIKLLTSKGLSGRQILVYALYNFTDNPQDLFDRIRDTLTWGAVCYPMRYQPTNTLVKNAHISPKWDKIRLEGLQRARRVIGVGGAFPPYEGMMKVKILGCKSFDEAFGEFTKLEVLPK